jgi:hypothetical protein
MSIRYRTNWMGPISTEWYKDRGLTKRVTKILTEDNPLTGKKAGYTYEYDEVTTSYSAGRIDIYGTDDPYGAEMHLPTMRSEDWDTFSKWLSTFETDCVWKLEDLVELYQRVHPEIRWWKEPYEW